MPRLKQSDLDEMLKQERRKGYALGIFASRPVSTIPLNVEIQKALDERAMIHAEIAAERAIP